MCFNIISLILWITNIKYMKHEISSSINDKAKTYIIKPKTSRVACLLSD